MSFNYWKSLRVQLPGGINKSGFVQKGYGLQPASPLVIKNVISNFVPIHLLILSSGEMMEMGRN